MKRPLRGWTILVTRPAGQQRALARAVESMGAKTVHVPTFRIVPIAARVPTPDEAPRCVAAIFVSANAARLGAGELKRRWPRLPPCYAVGEATRRALAQRGVDALAPIRGDGAGALLSRPELSAPICGDVLVLGGADGLSELGDALGERGGAVRHCALYRRRRCSRRRRALRRALRLGALDALAATSLFGLKSLLALAGARRRLRAIALCVPGERLRAHAKRLGFRCIIFTPRADDASIARALAAHAARRRRPQRRWRPARRAA